MKPDNFVLPIWRPLYDAIKHWSDPLLTAVLLLVACVLVYIALQRNNLPLKAVALIYILLP